MVDIAIIGGGPAGLSAAINARARGKSVLVIGNPIQFNPLYKAHLVDNYPGLPNISGSKLLEMFETHSKNSGASLRQGRVLNITPFGNRFLLSIGSDMEEARCVIIATGTQRTALFPGEEEFLGRGVSWCATCDGMLYREKKVAVVGLSHDAPAEANFLHEIGCQVTYVSKTAPHGLHPDIPVVLGRQFSVKGDEVAHTLLVDQQALSCHGIFILRDTSAPNHLLPGLSLDNGYISVDRTMSTGIPGVFACGDCVGLPLQVAKAVGEGLIAGQSAAEYVEQLND